MDRIKFIVGIDYGTTFTGVSYVTSNQSDLDDINVVRAWPGPGRDIDATWKTPTRIAYGRENGFSGNKWGFEIEPSMKGYSWTKLLLDKNAAKSSFDDPTLAQTTGKGIMEVPPFRTAQGVCQDFLTEVRKCVFARLEKEVGADLIKITPVECWLTVPAIWSDEAKNATRSAAIAAGFAARDMDSINMIPEPEAAAIAALKKDTAPGAANPIKAGDDIMICDCGGGTVDLTTYSVTATYPVLDFEELVVGTGGKCGATYIDRNLHELMSRRFGASFTKLPPAKRGPGSRFMQSFESVKRDFGAIKDDRVKEIGPLKLNSNNSFYYDEDEGMVKLTQDDLAGLFDPVIDQVISLVAQQVNEAKKMNHSIDRMILVGGFGDSPYLFTKLQTWCKSNGNIRLLCPPHPQAAIVRGAALRGLCGTAPSSKRCRRHYGYTSGMVFRPGIDNEENAFFTPFTSAGDDGKRVRGRMTWIIEKGEEVTEETTRSVELYYSHERGDSLRYTMGLHSCGLDTGPDRVDDERVETMGSVTVDHSNVDLDTVPKVYKDGKMYWQLNFELRIQFAPKKGVLDFSSWVDGKRGGTATISYAPTWQGVVAHLSKVDLYLDQDGIYFE